MRARRSAMSAGTVAPPVSTDPSSRSVTSPETAAEASGAVSDTGSPVSSHVAPVRARCSSSPSSAASDRVAPSRKRPGTRTTPPPRSTAKLRIAARDPPQGAAGAVSSTSRTSSSTPSASAADMPPRSRRTMSFLLYFVQFSYCSSHKTSSMTTKIRMSTAMKCPRGESSRTRLPTFQRSMIQMPLLWNCVPGRSSKCSMEVTRRVRKWKRT